MGWYRQLALNQLEPGGYHYGTLDHSFMYRFDCWALPVATGPARNLLFLFSILLGIEQVVLRRVVPLLCMAMGHWFLHFIS